MTNTKMTKKALFLSCMSMLLCVTMLVGTTFAWFTDTATTGVNTIVAGNLDIVLEYWNGTEWEEVDESTLLFNKDALYEPGFTEVAYLRIRNNGSLTLKYNLNINVANEVAGKTKEGKSILLSEHLKFGVITSEINKDVTIYENRAEAQKAVEGIATGLKSYSTNDYVELAPESYYTMALVVFMPTTVGNEANHDGVNVPSIDLGVSLFATQKDAESDSFNNEYDKNAPTLITVEGSSVAYATIDEAFEATGATTFNVSGPIDVTKMSKVFSSAARSAGKTVTFNQIEGAIDAYYDFSGTDDIINANGANIVINGGYIQGKNANEGSGFGFQSTTGTITYNGVTINDSWTNENGATVVYNDCTFTGTYYVWTYSVPSITFTGCTFDKADSRAILVYSHGNNPITAKIENCTFKADAKGYAYGPKWTAAVEIDASYITDGAKVEITNCTADANYNGIARDKAGKNATITVDGTPFITGQTAFEQAIDDEVANIFLAAGEYTMVSTNYDVTISGTEATLLNLKANSCPANGNTITFKGITIVGEDDIGGWYTEQLKNAEKVVYEDCTINGLITAYGSSDFTRCEFNNDFSDEYSVYCYANGTFNFTDCTFNTACSKAIKVYDENNGGEGDKIVNVTRCSFVAEASDKAAVEIDSGKRASNPYIVKITDCKINEFYTKLWFDKSTNSKVYVDGGIASASALKSELENAKEGETVKVGNTTIEVTDIPAGVTIQGNGAEKTTLEVGSNLTVTNNNVTIKDVEIVGNFNNAAAIKLSGEQATISGVVLDDLYAYDGIYSTGTGDLTVEGSKIAVNNKAIHVLSTNTSKIEVTDCVLDALYPINVNTGACDIELIVKDSTLNGWTSYSSIKSASFTNVTFGKNKTYNQAYLRPYADTTLTNCSFVDGFMMGYGNSSSEKHTITLTNCTYNGTQLTADNIIGLLVHTNDSPDYGYMKANVTLIVDGVTVEYK